jgi:hypothetical protein
MRVAMNAMKSTKSKSFRSIPAGYPPLLRARLRSFGRLVRIRDVVAAAGLAVLVVAAMVAAGCCFDRFVDVPGTWRLPWTLLTAVATAALAGRLLLRLVWPGNYDTLAATLDGAAGDTRQHLRSLLDFVRRGLPASSFVGISAERGEAFWRSRRVAGLVDRRPLVIPLAAGLLVAVIFAVSQIEAVRAGLLWQRFIDPLGNHMRPTATWLEVEPPPANGFDGGDDYVIRARLRGRPVIDPVPLARVEMPGRPATVARLKPRGDAWELPVGDVQRDFSFVASLGPARSAEYRVAVRPRPRIERIAVSYRPPSYTGLPRRDEVLTGRTITALEETKLRIEITADVPLASATGRIGADEIRFTVDPRDSRKASCFVFLSANARMDMSLVAESGLDNPRELPLHLRVIPDAAPVILATNDPSSRPCFPGDTLRFDYKAQDDIGLADVALVSVSGGFTQEAELAKIGLREASGSIAVPVSALATPGSGSVQVRLTALDGKGQRGNSPVMTLQIASASYEQQLRAVLRSLDGRQTGGPPHLREQFGFPSRERHAARLKSLRGLQAKIAILRELGGDPADPKVAPQVAEARKLMAFDSGFDYLMPYQTVGHGGLRALDVIGRMPMTVRLQAIVRDATCGAEIAVPLTTIQLAFETAITAADRPAALEGFANAMGGLVTRQEAVVTRLDDFARMTQVELAGLLATRLSRGLPAEADRDQIVATTAQLEELVRLVTGPLSAAPEGQSPVVPAEQAKALAAVMGAADQRAALDAAVPPCAALVRVFEAEAARLAVDPAIQEIGLDAAVADLGPGPEQQGRRDIYALWIDLQTDDTDIDETRLLAHAAALERLVAGGAFASLPATADDPAAIGLRMATCLSRFADQAAVVRGAIVSGASEDPTLREASWVRLRELAFMLARESSVGGGLPPEFLASLEPARPWLPAPDALAALVPTLTAWETRARALSAGFMEPARQRLANVASEIATWPAADAAALDAYGRDIEALVAALEAGLTSDDLYRRLPQFDARLAVTAAALLERLAVAEAARLQGVGPDVGIDAIATARIAVGKLREHLGSRVGAVSSLGQATSKSVTVNPQDAVRTLALGKAKVCTEHRGLVAEVRRLCDPATTPEARQAVLASLGVGHIVEKEQKAMGAAIGIVTAAPVPAAALLGLPSAEGVGAAMFWERVLFSVAELRAAVEREDATAASMARESVAARMKAVATPPQQARGLADWLAQPPETSLADKSRAAKELAEIATELATLARPPAVYPAELRLAQQWQAVWRQRFRLADDRADDATARGPLSWAVTDVEWLRRKREAAAANVGIGSLQVGAEDDLAALKLPKHIIQELRRAREGTIPELYRDRSHTYMSTILEKAR